MYYSKTDKLFTCKSYTHYISILSHKEKDFHPKFQYTLPDGTDKTECYCSNIVFNQWIELSSESNRQYVQNLLGE